MPLPGAARNAINLSHTLVGVTGFDVYTAVTVFGVV